MNKLTHGYKQTEVGVIPEDWEIMNLGDIMDFQGGSQPPLTTFIHSAKEGYIRLLQIRDYKTDKFETYIPTKFARRFCDENDIMIGRYGPPIFQILRGLKGAYNVALIKAVPSAQINKEYAYHFLKQDILFHFIEKLSQRSSGQTGVDIQELRAYPIPVPPKAEQTAIANALSDADALITSLEKLIEKKRNIKQGAMQKLLQPKEGWEVKRLGELFEITSSKRVFQSEWKTEGIPFYRARELAVLGERGHLENELFITKSMYVNYKKQYGVPELGDMLVTGVGTLGKTFIVDSNKEFYFKDGNIIWFKIKKSINSIFLQQLFLTPFIIKQIEDSSAGTTVGTYTITDAKKTVVPYPSIEEQTLIASILSDMDNEITALENKLEKYKNIKLGMMQNLLTGRIRLVD